MKNISILCLLTFYSLPSFAQNNAMLTKDETISYLNKVLQKAKGYKCINTGHGTMTNSITEISFKLEDEGITFSYSVDAYYVAGPGDCSRGCNEVYSKTNKFNPTYITEVSLLKNYGKDPVYCCAIKFLKKELVKETIIYEGSRPSVNQTISEVKLYFFMAENNDFEKLKKAFYHLRDLYKAEEDPFGE